MSATTKRKKKRKRNRAKMFTWEQNHSLTVPAHPVHVDLDALFATIDAGPESEEEKKVDKEIATYLAFFADKNGKVRVDDDLIHLPTTAEEQ